MLFLNKADGVEDRMASRSTELSLRLGLHPTSPSRTRFCRSGYPDDQIQGSSVMKNTMQRTLDDGVDLAVGAGPSSRNPEMENMVDHHSGLVRDIRPGAENCCNKMSSRRRRGGGRSLLASEKMRNRMIRNQESAARSRARKQAQEAKLQRENMVLKKENDLLKRVARHLLAISRAKRMKSSNLSRTFPAPM